MVDTIQKALFPLRMASFLFGLGILSPLNRPKRYLSVLYIFIVWLVYSYLFYEIFINFIVIDRPTVHYSIAYFMMVVNLTVAFLSVVTVFAHENFEMCIKRIALVNDTLEKLGTPKEYRKMRNSVLWLLFVWFGMVCVATAGDCSWFGQMYSEISCIIISLVMDYTIHINTFTDMMFMFLMRYIGTRLDKINDHILQLTENDECGLRCTRRKSITITRRYFESAKYRMRVLWTAMHLHLELCRIARNINYLFGIQITLQMMSYFVILTGMIYFQYSTIMCVVNIFDDRMTSIKLFIFTITWFTILITKLISMNYVCESISTKARKTKEIVHKLTNLIYFTKAVDEICQFILQLSLRPLKISGIYLFYFGYNFLYKFFIQILTFIIIMMQVNSNILIMTFLQENYNVSCSIDY